MGGKLKFLGSARWVSCGPPDAPRRSVGSETLSKRYREDGKMVEAFSLVQQQGVERRGELGSGEGCATRVALADRGVGARWWEYEALATSNKRIKRQSKREESVFLIKTQNSTMECLRSMMEDFRGPTEVLYFFPQSCLNSEKMRRIRGGAIDPTNQTADCQGVLAALGPPAQPHVSLGAISRGWQTTQTRT